MAVTPVAKQNALSCCNITRTSSEHEQRSATLRKQRCRKSGKGRGAVSRHAAPLWLTVCCATLAHVCESKQCFLFFRSSRSRPPMPTKNQEVRCARGRRPRVPDTRDPALILMRPPSRPGDCVWSLQRPPADNLLNCAMLAAPASKEERVPGGNEGGLRIDDPALPKGNKTPHPVPSSRLLPSNPKSPYRKMETRDG